jgi:hypothetical protein
MPELVKLDHVTELAVCIESIVEALSSTVSTPAIAVSACVEAAVRLTEQNAAAPMSRVDALEHLLKTLRELHGAELQRFFHD